MQQPTLWQDDKQANGPVALHLGDTFEMGFCWADGDISPKALEELAQSKEGTSDIIEDTQGGWHSIWIHRAWVDEQRKCVRGLCEAVRCPLSGRNSYDPNEAIEHDESEDEETF